MLLFKESIICSLFMLLSMDNLLYALSTCLDLYPPLSCTDKIVVGSYMGMLRIFSPHLSKPGEASEADAQLLEVHLRDPIIQVELGKFVS